MIEINREEMNRGFFISIPSFNKTAPDTNSSIKFRFIGFDNKEIPHYDFYFKENPSHPNSISNYVRGAKKMEIIFNGTDSPRIDEIWVYEAFW